MEIRNERQGSRERGIENKAGGEGKGPENKSLKTEGAMGVGRERRGGRWRSREGKGEMGRVVREGEGRFKRGKEGGREGGRRSVGGRL